MAAEIPERELPKFKVTEEQVEELKAISAITSMLAEDPKFIKDIAKTIKEVSKTYEKELKEKVSGMIAEKVDIEVGKVAKIFPHWFPHIVRYIHLWIPHIHIWYPVLPGPWARRRRYEY